jgi:predicted nucleic acid-binding protein
VIVVCDTSPINYLVLIGHIDVLFSLFREVVIPSAVFSELKHARTPQEVRQWIAQPPAWLQVRSPTSVDPSLRLGRGETEAISLALELKADLLLMDDRPRSARG